MKDCKRIEIVIEEPMAERVIETLREVGIRGYTAIAQASGEGDRGRRRGDELAGDSSNTLFIIACDDDGKVDALVESLRPLLSRSGGICLVSSASWVLH